MPDPERRFIHYRPDRRSKFQVRIPLDRKGRHRHIVGSYSLLGEAVAARDFFLWQAGVRRGDGAAQVYE